MSGELLPLFPLRVVALPDCSIPLHIFEERYKAMVSLALKEQSEFGIVLAEGRGIVSAGCSVSVDEVVHRYDDGRMDIVCVGRRRFRIAALDREEDLLKAHVQYFDDEDTGSTPASRIEALSAWEQAMPLRTGLVRSGSRRSDSTARRRWAFRAGLHTIAPDFTCAKAIRSAYLS